MPVAGLNHVPLSPISYLKRVVDVYPQQPAVIYGNRHYNWQQLSLRAKRLASALNKLKISKGSTVCMIAANTPEMIEAHYGIPMSGAVISALNTRLDADTIAYILQHSDCQLLIADSCFSATVKNALSQLKTPPIVIDIVDQQMPAPTGAGERLGEMDYEQLLELGDPNADWGLPESEWDAIALNYTSGTSGRPKGVIYHHRGSYLMSMATVAAWQLPKHPRYLYTVPLFHCNGWGHAWTMAIMAGTMICNRVISPEVIFDAIIEHRISHFGAAPIILSMLASAPAEQQQKLLEQVDDKIEVMTAGAPPPSSVLDKASKLGFNIIHVYGLTETYGHVIYCDWQEQWNELDDQQKAELKARQGVRLPMMETATVIDIGSGQPVPADGETIGEIVLQGNTVMKGYYKDPEATNAAFKDGWFHTGDLAVLHPDNYIEIKDRLKDIIISGGENISSVEVESALYKFPNVTAAAVVAQSDEKWGEVPHAFVEMEADCEPVSAAEIIAFCRDNMAHFKCPKKVTFMEIPKTSTGKIQKFNLRQLIQTGNQ